MKSRVLQVNLVDSDFFLFFLLFIFFNFIIHQLGWLDKLHNLFQFTFYKVISIS
jgi:hypothetical protein